MLDRDTVAMLADFGTYLGVDLFDGEWALAEGNAVDWPADTMRKLRETMDTGIAAFRWAVEAGAVRITYSTDSGVYPHELVARQFDAYVRFGMEPLAAIRSATVTAAECLGWADRVGTLRPGRFAGLVAVEGNPLEDVRLLEAPVAVMKGGRLAVDRRGEVAGRARSSGAPDARAARDRPPGHRRPLGGGRRGHPRARPRARGHRRRAPRGDGHVQPARVPGRHLHRADRRLRPVAGRSSTTFAVGNAAMVQLEAGGEGLATYALASEDVAGDVVGLKAAGSTLGLPVTGAASARTARSSAGSTPSRSWGRLGRRSSSSTRRRRRVG